MNGNLRFAATALTKVWGIGRRIGAQLLADGLKTVADVVAMDAATVRRRWSVVLERTVRELQGETCIGFEDAPPAKKEIACTRSFGEPVTQRADLIEAVSNFASRASEKLRRAFVPTSLFDGPGDARKLRCKRIHQR